VAELVEPRDREAPAGAARDRLDALDRIDLAVRGRQASDAHEILVARCGQADRLGGRLEDVHDRNAVQLERVARDAEGRRQRRIEAKRDRELRRLGIELAHAIDADNVDERKLRGEHVVLLEQPEAGKACAGEREQRLVLVETDELERVPGEVDGAFGCASCLGLDQRDGVGPLIQPHQQLQALTRLAGEVHSDGVGRERRRRNAHGNLDLDAELLPIARQHLEAHVVDHPGRELARRRRPKDAGRLVDGRAAELGARGHGDAIAKDVGERRQLED
jgi:hypothetical protein